MAWTRNRPTGLTHRDAGASEGGYTLYSVTRGRTAHLLDAQGRTVHRWYHPEGIQHVRLLDDGGLLVHTHPPQDAEGCEAIGGSSGALIELDWDSTVRWEYRDRFMHHDYMRKPDGTTHVIAWARMPSEARAAVRGGHDHDDDPDWMWGDVVRHVSASGEVLDEWRSWEHLSFDEHVMCPLESRKEWTHCNSIEPAAGGRWLLSFRLTSSIAIVSPSGGQVEWTYGPGVFSHQHHATWLDSGRVLVFDNGCHRARQPSYSEVVEVDPASREVAWKYTASPILAFFSFMVSGAQRLAGGNTFVTEGATGRLFEVTADGDIVWEYVSPWLLPTERFGESAAVFRAYRVAADDPRLAGRDLDPGRHAALDARIAAGEVLRAADDVP